MLTSDMVPNINQYMTDRALFNSDILNKALKWQVNYVHPLAVGYRAAKIRLEACIAEANKRAGARKQAYEELKARIDLATGILFSLMAPFASAAFTNLKTSMQVTDAMVDDRVLTKWYAANRSAKLDFDQLLNREKIRQRVLNHVVEQGITAAQGQVTAGNFSPAAATGGTAPTPTGNRGATTAVAAAPGFALPEALVSGEFTPAEFEQNVQTIFNRFAVNLHDRYQTLFNGPADAKRRFLVNATKTVLACPPPDDITTVIPARVLENQLFGMVAGNYILSFTAVAPMAFPTIGVDLAYTINRALQDTGNSIITNNPRPGTQAWSGGQDMQMAWDGLVMPTIHGPKIREIGQGNAAVLEAYMQAIAATNASV